MRAKTNSGSFNIQGRDRKGLSEELIRITVHRPPMREPYDFQSDN